MAAEFVAADAATPRATDTAVRAGDEANARFIVANAPEGRKLADALADRLSAKGVVFENFPRPGEAHGFDAMVRRNVAALVEASRP